jgi:hypothetical protein
LTAFGSLGAILISALVVVVSVGSSLGATTASRGSGPNETVPAAAAGLVVNDLDNGATANGLAQTLAGPGVTISNVVSTGTNNAFGSFVGGSGIIGFDAGIVLGSGSVQTSASHTAPCEKGVEGPNECDDNTTVNGTAGDTNLTALAGFATNDAAVLEFDFVPTNSTVAFNYVFSSDEYNEFANSEFNDVFAFYVNGANCALVPGTSSPVSINTINGGNPLGTDPQHPEFYVNNDADDGGALNTEMDGLTTVLSCTATVNANQTNHMKLAIADGSDAELDSNVFIQAGSFVSPPPTTAPPTTTIPPTTPSPSPAVVATPTFTG